MKLNYSLGKAGIVTVLLATWTGCTTYVVQRPEPQTAYVPSPPPPASAMVEQAPPPPLTPPAVVVIQSDDDFVQPLSPYGDWVAVGSYGRCWRPTQVEASWRPYANGHWELTGDGWYWVSDEPWAWATYHYGRWQLAGSYGWVWVPQTQWAPAWVSWREGGGYVGWAPLPPEPRGGVSVNVTIAPAAFCFVEERRMHDPVRPTTVIVNNTTIINKTVIITKTKVVNKVVINDGPRADEIERVTGRKIQQVSVSDLRNKDEEPVAEKHGNLRARPDRAQQPEPKKLEPKQPEPQKETRPLNLQNRDRVTANPPPEKPVTPLRAIEKPVRQDPVRNKPVPARPPANVRPIPAPTAPTREVRPVEKSADQASPDVNNRDRQRKQPEVQPTPKPQPERDVRPPKQQNESTLKNGRNTIDRNGRSRDAGSTNAVENSGPGGRRQ